MNQSASTTDSRMEGAAIASFLWFELSDAMLSYRLVSGRERRIATPPPP